MNIQIILYSFQAEMSIKFADFCKFLQGDLHFARIYAKKGESHQKLSS